jgi:hypothetical protein
METASTTGSEASGAGRQKVLSSKPDAEPIPRDKAPVIYITLCDCIAGPSASNLHSAGNLFLSAASIRWRTNLPLGLDQMSGAASRSAGDSPK